MKQLFTVLLTAIVAFLLGTKFYYYSPLYRPVKKSVALIYPTQAGKASGNEVTGKVIFTSMQSGGVRIEAELHGLKPGIHGFHIHEFGNCLCPQAKCAGDHFNSTNKKHGGPQDAQRHVGDLGNITADVSGNAHLILDDYEITLNGPHSIIGRSVIIHENADDFTSQPSGALVHVWAAV